MEDKNKEELSAHLQQTPVQSQYSTVNSATTQPTSSEQQSQSSDPKSSEFEAEPQQTSRTPIDKTAANPPQDKSPQTDTNNHQVTNSTKNPGKKLKFWKRASIIVGIISLVSYFVFLIVANISAHEAATGGWVIIWMAGILWQQIIFILCAVSIIALIKIIILSQQRKKHLLKDYLAVIVGLMLAFSPFAVSGILSLFRITWNENGDITISVKANDPYYITRSDTGLPACHKKAKTSNELRNIDIDQYYSYVDKPDRQKFATERYLESIAEETMCQIGDFYRKNGRYPNENEIEDLSLSAPNNDVRNGLYHIKPEVGARPNKTDFTILIGRTCNNKKVDEGNIAVLSPLYDKAGRSCIYNYIDDIIEGIAANEAAMLPSDDTSTPNDSSTNHPISSTTPHTVAHRCWGAVSKGQVFAAEDLDDYAIDIACAYLSYQAHEKATPTTQADIMKYLPADYAELLPDHATPTITINADNPTQPYTFNICTSPQCNSKFNHKKVSVFYTNPLKANQLGLSEVESYDASLYDLNDTDSWYNVIFDDYPRENTNRLYSNAN